MAASKSTDHFDLLPFIAILMCTLGTLLLVTLCMAAINMGPGAGEAWIPTPDPNRVNKIPVLFQWDGEVLTAQWDTNTLRYEIPIMAYWEAPGGSSEEKGLGERVKEGMSQLRSGVMADLERHSDTHYALFAVRPSGFTSFLSLRSEFDEEKIPVGYEPIPQSKSVRLGNAAKPSP
jgi:hypothetical protein